MHVKVLGNLVEGSTINIEVRGAEGQPLRFQLMDLRGQLVSNQFVSMAKTVERQTLPIGNQSSGLFLIQVSTPTQQQTLKVSKVN
ncbi:hypothetical protein GCM10028805_24070 [Spirosoma harenae]